MPPNNNNTSPHAVKECPDTFPGELPLFSKTVHVKVARSSLQKSPSLALPSPSPPYTHIALAYTTALWSTLGSGPCLTSGLLHSSLFKLKIKISFECLPFT